MDFDKIKEKILSSSETSESENENIAGSELHEEFEINNFLPEFEPLKLSGKNLAQQYVSAFNTGMNIYQCLNYLQGYVYTLVTAMNETIDAWNTVVPLLEQATKEWTDEEFDYKWSILKPQVIELVTNLTIETFNKSWEELKPQVIKLAQDTTDAEFKKQWDILKPQVIELVQNTTTEKFNSEWEKLKPTIIQLSTDTTIEQFNRSWTELKPQVIELAQNTTNTKFDEKWTELRPQLIELAQTTTSDKFDEKWTELQPTLTETVNNLAKTQTTTTFNEEWEKLKPQVIELTQTTTSTKFDEKWTELRPQLIELAQTTTSDKFDEKWTELQPTLTETVNNLAKTQTTTTFNEEWEKLKPQVIELTQTTTSTKFDEKWTELQPTLTETVNNLVNTNLETFKSTLWQEVTKNESFPFLLPENFGAVGDGNTDDKQAFNACFAEASETNKNVLLSTKAYLIGGVLQATGGFSIIGLNTQIVVNDNDFLVQTENITFKNIFFLNKAPSNNARFLIYKARDTYFDNCEFIDMGSIYGELLENTKNTQLLNNCRLLNTSIYYKKLGVTPSENKVYVVNNTFIRNTNNMYHSFWNDKSGSKIYFNNCSFNSDFTKYNVTMFPTVDNMIFNNCSFNVKNTLGLIGLLTVSTDTYISFNKCNINAKSIVNNGLDNYLYLNIKDSVINVDKIMNNSQECSLWLENNKMDTKPIINSGTGKVNLIEIQQKYSSTTENVFPWDKDTPTVENNVKINKNGDADYYVLTENKYTNIKKLDYYFNYSLNYLPNAPYYNNNIIFGGLGLLGYTVKKALLNNELCKLKNESGELIDYVYMMLDECTVNTEESTLGEETTIAMKFLPYFAKLKTDTAIAGQCDVNMCISIILEKTS